MGCELVRVGAYKSVTNKGSYKNTIDQPGSIGWVCGIGEGRMILKVTHTHRFFSWYRLSGTSRTLVEFKSRYPRLSRSPAARSVDRRSRPRSDRAPQPRGLIDGEQIGAGSRHGDLHRVRRARRDHARCRCRAYRLPRRHATP